MDAPHPLRRRLAISVALIALVGLGSGCGTTVPSTAPAASSSAGPTGSAAPSGPVASFDIGGLTGRITSQELAVHLDALDRIARDNGGTRATGSPGDSATVDYIRGFLADLGYAVSEDAFESPVYRDPGGSEVAILGDGGRTFASATEVLPFIFAGRGSASGKIVDLGWDPSATDADGKGCDRSDFAGVPAGAIVLVRSGPCARRSVILNAQGAGAAALVGAVPWYPTGEVRRATLLDPDGMTIPAVAASREVGTALAAAAASGATVRITTTATNVRTTLHSVIAELPGTDPGKVVMVGAHLDSSMEGPGVDDDGTGVAALLELARAVVGTQPVATIRFAFWAAEETGLQGSGRYVSLLSSEERGRLVAYLNADMLGSPNGFRGVYDEPQAASGSSAIRDLFGSDLDAAGLAWEPMDVGLGSDHRLFALSGIPTGGLFSGALELVTAEQAERYGRTAGAWADACYHLACDGRSNVDESMFLELARSFARVTLHLASAPGGPGG